MSFKRESMPSINESDNEDEDNLSVSEEFSTSDYASLNRHKNSTLTKAMNEVIENQEELVNKDATLKQIDLLSNEIYLCNTNDNHSNDSDLSQHSLESDKNGYLIQTSENQNYFDNINVSNDKIENNELVRTQSIESVEINGLKICNLECVKLMDESDCDNFNETLKVDNASMQLENEDLENVEKIESISLNLSDTLDSVSLKGKDEIKSLEKKQPFVEKVAKVEIFEIDRFGFLKGNHYTDPNCDTSLPIYVIRARERKWQEMLNKWEDYKTKKHKKMVSRCRKGIPQSMRCKAWQFLCNSRSLETTFQERTYYKDQLRVPKRKETMRISFRNSTQAVNNSDNDSISVSSFYSTISPAMKSDCIGFPVKSQHHELYETYKKCTPNCEIVEQIRKDIHRQFPNHENFMQKGGLGQESLSSILTVYSIRHPETGYCQGMAPLAAALLMVMPEEDAFWTFDKICDSYIPGYYDEGLKQIQVDAKALNALLKKESSSVYNFMNSNQIDPICYMIDWFMCIYIRSLPWPSVLQVMDMFLCEGKSILFKVALVLIIGAINIYKQTSKDCQDTDILTALRNLPENITTTKYITTHIAKLTVTKTDIKRECQNQETLMAKAKAKLMSISKGL